MTTIVVRMTQPCIRIARRALVIIGLTTPIHVLSGQAPVVFYDHRPGQAPLEQRMGYLLAGERTRRSARDAERHIGRPPMLTVRRGSDACVVVETANPLLYVYAISAKAVTVEQSADLATLIKEFGASGLMKPTTGAGQIPITSSTSTANAALLKTMSAKEQVYVKALVDTINNLRSSLDVSIAVQNAAEASLTSLTEYGKAVADVAKARAQLDELRSGSDRVMDMEALLKAGNAALEVLRAKDKAATAQYGPHKGETAYDLLHGVQQEQLTKGVQIAEEFTALENAGDPTFCVTPKDARMRVAVTVAAKYKAREGEKRARPVDTVAFFDVETVDDQRFEVIPAGFVAFGVSEATTFSVADGVVTARPDRSPIVTPGLFALARVADAPLWGALGVSRGREKVDLFFGLAIRGGASVVGSNLVVGAGLTLARVVIGLDKGAVGEALPADVSDLKSILRYGYRPGGAVVFTLSGLALGGSAPAAK